MKLMKLLGMASVLFVVSMQELSGATLVNRGGKLGGTPTPWFWASAFGTRGIKYGYGANAASAQENAMAVADGRANPAQLVTATTYTGSYTAMHGGVSKTATATSTVSQADANARAQQAWHNQNRTYRASLFGFSDISTVSQADANFKVREAWLRARLSGGAIIDKNNYAATGWTEISNGARGNLQMTFTALATNDLHIGLKYGNSNYLEIVIGGWNNRKSVVRIFENGRQQGSDIVATGPVPTNPNALVIPSVGSAIPLALTISGNNLMVKNGATTLVSCSNPAFNQIFTAYSFRTHEAFSFAIHKCVVETSVDSKEASIQALIGSMQSLLPNSKVVRGSIGNNPKLETQFGRDVTDLKISFKAVTKKDMIVCLRTKDGYLGISLPAQGNQGRIYYAGGDSLAWPNEGMMSLGVPLNLEIKIYKNVLSIAGLTAPCEINLKALSALSTAGKAYTGYFFEGSDSASPWVVADEVFEELKQLVDPLVQKELPLPQQQGEQKVSTPSVASPLNEYALLEEEYRALKEKYYAQAKIFMASPEYQKAADQNERDSLLNKHLAIHIEEIGVVGKKMDLLRNQSAQPVVQATQQSVQVTQQQGEQKVSTPSVAPELSAISVNKEATKETGAAGEHAWKAMAMRDKEQFVGMGATSELAEQDALNRAKGLVKGSWIYADGKYVLQF